MARRAQIHPTDPVARRLFFSRVALGWEDQGAYAQNANIPPNTYNEYERGKKTLTLRAARELRNRYSLPIEWLLDGVTDRLPHGLVKKLEIAGAFVPIPLSPERDGASSQK